jgi:hypothetical protein
LKRAVAVPRTTPARQVQRQCCDTLSVQSDDDGGPPPRCRPRR